MKVSELIGSRHFLVGFVYKSRDQEMKIGDAVITVRDVQHLKEAGKRLIAQDKGIDLQESELVLVKATELTKAELSAYLMVTER